MEAIPCRARGEARYQDDGVHAPLEAMRLRLPRVASVASTASRHPHVRVLTTWADVLSGKEVLGALS
ncbi:MAG TPA: hypothetical protein VEF92_09765, partial [Burkholderiales bacterium]|nr:hypothetical protein [Burkholderiales bacterium]